MTLLSPGSMPPSAEGPRRPTPTPADLEIDLTDLDAPPLPSPRGVLTEQLLDHLVRPVHELSRLPESDDDPLTGDDAALALHVCYELHYRGFADVDEAWEWEPSLLRERQRLEAALEARLAELIGLPPVGLSVAATVDALLEQAGDDDGASLSAYMATRGTLDQMREFAVHRSAYQLKEADPHTWAIPRLWGPAKAALIDIQIGEYGGGDPERVHATLFADTMRELRLDTRYGAYIDHLPGITLTTGNLVSLLGLHRRWRGALVGHLAMFEMCSVGPMGRYRDALRRLRVGPKASRFYEEHVIADERHQVVALHEMVAGLVDQEPMLGGEVVYGATALTAVERLFAQHLLEAWQAGRSSLLAPLR